MLKTKMEKEDFYEARSSASSEPEQAQEKEFMTQSTFASLKIDKLTKQSLKEVFKYPTMTKVQEETLPIALTGVDMVA